VQWANPTGCSREHKEVQEQVKAGEVGGQGREDHAKFAVEEMMQSILIYDKQ
jgi:hypothetical protein